MKKEDLIEYQDETTDLQVRTKEQYGFKYGKHVLYLITEAFWKDGKWKEIDKVRIDLPPEVPRYITKLKLWHHTDYQLKELERLRKSKDEKTPSDTTLKDWKSWMELQASTATLQDSGIQ
jgi:hypothetical protein